VLRTAGGTEGWRAAPASCPLNAWAPPFRGAFHIAALEARRQHQAGTGLRPACHPALRAGSAIRIRGDLPPKRAVASRSPLRRLPLDERRASESW